MKSHLGILATHQIQYQAPWFRALAERPEIDLEVLYCHRAAPQEQAGAGFNVEFDWDVSLLDGYSHRFLRNVARKPSLHGFAGIDTPEIATIVKEENFDAVIVNGWNYKSAWQAMRACWRTRTPVMVRSDSHLLTERSPVKKLAKLPLYRWFIPKLDACLPVGKWSRDYFLHYGAKPNRVFVVPHVVDVKFFRSEAQRLQVERSKLRQKWMLDEDAIVFLFVGKFIPKKRPLDFVSAIANANSNGTRIMGLMVGDGPLRITCNQAVENTNAPIRFTGFLNQSEISQAYAVADALVLPSDGGETWGMVVNEAMASGLPCFVSDAVGCGPDMIAPGQTGDIFALGDINWLASLLTFYAERSDGLTRMGETAKCKINEYSFSAAVEGVMHAIRAVSN